MRRLPTLFLAATLLATPAIAVHAQSNHDGHATMAPSAALNDMINAAEGEIIAAAKAMPADKYNFAPNASTFAAGSPQKFETVRTFGQEVAHLAGGNYHFFSAASGMKPDVDVKAIGSMTSKAELVTALEKSFAFAHKAAAMITAANAFETVKPIDGQHTRFTIAAFATAHANDHYGQMVEYLRMNGIIPPASVRK